MENDNIKLSLKEFINQNKNLLSAMAVMFAIASFSSSLSVNWLGNVLLFLSISGVVTVWVELYKNFPKTGSIRLMLFKNILSLGLIGFILYWFLAFGKFWNIFLFIPLFCLMFYMSYTILKQLMSLSLSKKIMGEKGKRNIGQKVLIVIYWLAVFYAVNWMLYLSIGASPAINYLFEFIRLNFH